MKTWTKLVILGFAMMTLPAFVQAQNVDVDNQTPCDFTVKVNETFSTTGCPMGTGPVMNCPATTLTTMVAAPPLGYQVVAYGVNPTGGGGGPVVVNRPGCGPRVITVAGWCGGVTIEYRNRLLVIR
ncbi:hypothetical protein KFE98_17265 [bacterium SCSIO 12741]|nr:hypothetical protein KFE98_17265 [bacterium SCSIO 12741]